jgi:hypothetical protein
VQHLRLVLDVLRREKFYARMDKCAWLKPELFYLGHIVSAAGVRMDPAKVAAIKNWPVPTDVHSLRQFLGLAQYFKRHLHNYAVVAAPLTNLLRKGVVFSHAWGSQHTDAFNTVKKLVSEDILLQYPDFNKPFELISDASVVGCGAVLLQDGKPVAFTSKKFSPAEQNYATGEQELAGIHHALFEWRCYLEGSVTKLVTDHHPLVYLQSQPSLSRRQARWMEFFSRFQYTWEHRPGRDNIADGLSRYAVLASVTLAALTRRQSDFPLKQRIAEASKTDPWFANACNTQSLQLSREGIWLRTVTDTHVQQIVVPDDVSLRKEIINTHHNGPLAGHQGVNRTLEAMSRRFWWPGLKADVEAHVTACDACQRNKSATGKPYGLLQPLAIPTAPFESVSADFIVGMPVTPEGYNSILVLVDRLTKMVHLVPCKDSITAEQFADLFFRTIVRAHGMPKSVITDRGPQFAGKFWQHLCKLLDCRSNLSSAYHPQSDGQTERVNRVVGDMLRNYVGTEINWEPFLPLAEFAINNSVNRSTGQSPFYLIYGRHPSTPVTRELDDTVPEATITASALMERLSRARTCLEAAQQRAKAYADQDRRPASFAVDQQVMLSTVNIKRTAKGSRKLLPKWLGPFKIKRVIRDTAVELELPDDMKMHNVFHVSLIKPYRSDGSVQPPLPVYWDDEGVSFKVDRILDHRDRKQGRRTIREYLVRWEGYGPEHNSWEPDSNFHDRTCQDLYWSVRREADARVTRQRGG